MGTDEIVGILESIGTEIRNGVISSDYLDARKIYKWEPVETLRLADLVSRLAFGHGINNELSTMTPYDLPQQWAIEFERDTEGILYRSRFDLGETARAVAHFGSAGESTRAVGSAVPIDITLRQRLLTECGIEVEAPPQLSQLTVADDPF
jgi:hypothetical protein